MKIHVRREQKGIIFLILIILIIIALGIFFYMSIKTDPVKENLKKDPIIKALIIIENEGKALFTDVFIYYPESCKGALVAIPGNTGAIYSTLGRVDRIDSIYSEISPDAYKKEIETLVDVVLPFYIRINLEDFATLTDLLGGLDVFIPSPVDARGKNEEIWLLPSGAITLDGDKIKTYLTYSLPDETESNINDRRQNAVVALLGAISRNKNYIFKKENFEKFSPCFVSNTDKESLFELLQLFAAVDSERLTILEVTGTSRVIDGKQLLLPFRNGDFIKEVVRNATTSILSTSALENDRNYVIEIQNGTRVQGLAHNTQILLQGAGFDVLNISNAPSNDFEKTQIIDHIGNANAAKSVGNFIRCYTIVEEEIQSNSEEVSNVDFTLILGKDFDGRYVHGQTPIEENEDTTSKVNTEVVN